MDALFKALDERGLAVEVGEGDRSAPLATITMSGQSLAINLAERVERVERKQRNPYRDWGLAYMTTRISVCTRRLSLSIVDSDAREVRKTWSDGKRQRLEDCLNSFIVGLVVAAEVKAKVVAERDEWWRRWEEERRRRLEAEHKREEERQRIEQLEAWTEAWTKADRIRRFIAAVRESSAQEVNAPPVMPLAEWLSWAKGYANEIDPIAAERGVFSRPS
jgi:hypothetical protein